MLLPFIVAAAIAYIVNQLVVRFQPGFSMCRWLAGIVTFALVVALGGGVAIRVGLSVWHDVRDIVVALRRRCIRRWLSSCTTAAFRCSASGSMLIN